MSPNDFTEEDWEDEQYSLIAERTDPLPCPSCGRTGFFGPRARDNAPKYRGCRFCGFVQEVGNTPTRWTPVAHGCEGWPEAAGAPYLWWVPPDQEWFDCIYCGQRTKVKGATPFQKGAVATAPVDDEDHPWQRIPQGQSYQFYYNYWERWPSTKGRAVL